MTTVNLSGILSIVDEGEEMRINCLPFIPGDVRGDPELGGWRPLPRSYYGKYLATLNTIGLEQALQCLGFELRYRQLKRGMEIMANALKNN